MDKTKEVVLDIRRPNGDLIFSNFTPEDHRQFEDAQANSGKSVKVRIIEKKGYKVKFLTRDADLVPSNRLFNKMVRLIENTVDFFVQGLAQLENNNARSINLLEHNIATYNALSLQEVEVLIPQSKIAGKEWDDKIKFVENQLKRNIRTTSEAFLRLAKYSLGTKAELTAYYMLIQKPDAMKFDKHRLYQVLMNSLHHFFPDFDENSIKIQMQFNNLEAIFHYDSVSVALFHILNNAAKYCVPHSSIDISIRAHGNQSKIEFSMLSLRIDDDELKNIFTERYSGKHAVSAKINGRGIGMFVAKELMKLNNGDIEVQCNRSTNKVYKSRVYENNKFILTLNS